MLKHVFRVNREFHDTDLSSSVSFAFHAIAIDERRKPFQATLWNQTAEGVTTGQQLEQRWFPGCHADVGGGNPDSRLSAITLDWMVASARRAGLDLAKPGSLGPPNFPRHHPDDLGPIQDSMTFFYRLFGPAHRTILRSGSSDGEVVSHEAKRRWAITDWRPVALIDLKRRVPAALGS